MTRPAIPPIAIHNATWRGLLVCHAPAIIVAIGLAVAIVGSALRLIDPVADRADVSTICGLAIMCGGLLLAYVCSRPHRVELFDEGLYWFDGRDQAAEWEEVEKIAASKTQTTIEFYDGQQLLMDTGLENLSQLRSSIEKATIAPLLKRAETNLRFGSISFGEIELSQEGLVINKKRFRWGRFVCAIREGHFIIAKATKWADVKHAVAVPLADISNLHVFRALLEHYRQPNRIPPLPPAVPI